jgi:PAS domain S-box-containing protein
MSNAWPMNTGRSLPWFVTRALSAYAAAFIIIAWSAGLWHMNVERTRSLARAERELTTLTVGVAQHIEAVLNDGIGAARAAVSLFELEGGFASNDDERATTLLRTMLTGGDYVQSLFVAGEGRFLQAGRAGRLDDAGKVPDWFNAHAGGAAGSWVGSPLRDDATRTALVPIAVRVSPPGAAPVWAGAVFAIESIEALYERQQFSQGVVVLISAEGALLARVPSPREFGQYVLGDALMASLRSAAGDSWQHPLRFMGPITGEPMMYVGRNVRGFPLAAGVGLPETAIFAPWEAQAWNIAGLLLLATVVIVLLTLFLQRAVVALKAREVQYRTLFDSAGVSVILMQDDDFLEMNRKTSEMFELPGTVPAGLKVWDLSPPLQPTGESSERLARDYIDLARKRGTATFSWIHRRLRSGEDFPAEVSLSTLSEGGSGLLLAIVHDVSALERARTEVEQLNADLEQRVKDRTKALMAANAQLAVANEELDSFAASASHDLRSPLSSISGLAGLLQMELHEGRVDTADRRLSRIQESARRMTEIIDALLTLARVTSRELHAEPVNLSDLAATVAAELRQLAPGHAVDLVIAPDMTVDADPRLMRAVLANLLGNAWKYTAGEPSPRVEFRCVRQDGSPTEYQVRDTGVGFDMRKASSLFKPFRRLHSAEQFPGMGVGLATVARIVRRYGGSIRAESSPGAGATFAFTLPAAEPPVRSAAITH